MTADSINEIALSFGLTGMQFSKRIVMLDEYYSMGPMYEPQPAENWRAGDYSRWQISFRPMVRGLPGQMKLIAIVSDEFELQEWFIDNLDTLLNNIKPAEPEHWYLRIYNLFLRM